MNLVVNSKPMMVGVQGWGMLKPTPSPELVYFGWIGLRKSIRFLTKQWDSNSFFSEADKHCKFKPFYDDF